MKSILFIQFLSKSNRNYYDLANGFSDTFDHCRNMGDFYWVAHEPDSTKWYVDETYEKRGLPIDRGKVYISASYINHLYQAYVWAKHYPGIDFVVGGPVAAQRGPADAPWEPLYFSIREGDTFPGNLTVTGRSVEDVLGIKNFSGRWHLDIPRHKVAPESPVYFSYTLDNGCYWGKCIYCNIKEAPFEFFRKRSRLDYRFETLDHPGKKIVRLNTGSITPRAIKQVFSTLPARPDLEYRTFMRPAKAENKALREVLEQRKEGFPSITIGIGIEFPSNRMLSYMDKGITTDDILETLEICAKYNIKANGNMIFGWENLQASDVSELEEFLTRMPAHGLTNVQLRWLYAHPHCAIHNQYQGEPIYLGPFYLGFKADIEPEKVDLNQEAAQLVARFAEKKHFSIEGLGNIKGISDD
jgi:hypothetical protein